MLSNDSDSKPTVVENNHNCHLVPFLHPSFLCPLFTADEEKPSQGKAFYCWVFCFTVVGFSWKQQAKRSGFSNERSFLSESA